MATVYTIPTKFTAIDGVSATVGKMERNIYSYAERANAGIARQERLFRRLTPSLSGATRQLLQYASAGAVIGGIAYSGKAIMDYETAIQSLQAVTGISNTELVGFKGEIKDLADISKKSATEVAGAFEVVGSAMSQYLQDPKALRQITEAGITLSKASRQELVPTLENLTSVMNQFDLKASQAESTINRLTAGEIVGSLRTSQVAESLKQFGANAYNANVSLAESVALVETLAKQRPAENLGIDARNLLLVLSASQALDKKAKGSLRRSGVDLDFLANKANSLSARLHELSKIQGDAVGMIRVFGERNVTAANVIFQQLATYDQYAEKIKTTNEAQNQAITNSNTLAYAVTSLKNTWLNYITTSDKATAGLDKAKMATQFLTENLDTIVNTVTNAVIVFGLWKAAIVSAKIATVGWSVAMGVSNVVTGASIGLLEKDAIAQTVSMTLKRANAIATAGLTENVLMLNAAIAANPVGFAIAGLAALAGVLYLVSQREKALIEQYKEKRNLDTVKTIKTEADEVQKLVEKYYLLGKSIRESNAITIREKKLKIDTERAKVEKELAGLKSEQEVEKNKIYLGDLLGTGSVETGRRAELQKQILEKETVAADLAKQNSYITQYARNAIDAGVIGQGDLGKTFGENKGKTSASGFDYMRKDDRPFFDYEKLRKIMLEREQKIVVEFKGAPAGTTVSSGTGLNTQASY